MKRTLVDDAVDVIMPRFTGANIWFTSKDENEFVSFCNSQLLSNGIGMMIRNQLELWDKNSVLHKHMKKEYDMDHPDDMGELILRKIYKKFKKDFVD